MGSVEYNSKGSFVLVVTCWYSKNASVVYTFNKLHSIGSGVMKSVGVSLWSNSSCLFLCAFNTNSNEQTDSNNVEYLFTSIFTRESIPSLRCVLCIPPKKCFFMSTVHYLLWILNISSDHLLFLILSSVVYLSQPLSNSSTVSEVFSIQLNMFISTLFL